MLAYAGGPAEYAGLVFDFVRSLKEFDNQFSTPCSPSGAADSIAPRIPPNRPRVLACSCIGSLVSWFVVVCVALQDLAVKKSAAYSLQRGSSEVFIKA